MNTKLNHIQDWLKLAEEANWSVSKLAKLCNVSPRTIERHFLKTFSKSPKAWFTEIRHGQAIELLRRGCSIKETSLQIGYRHPNHFTRVFKGYWGCSPTASAELKSKF